VIEVADKTEILADKNEHHFEQVPTAQSAHCAFSIDIDDMVLKTP
jgi:hypothetical protein